MKKAEVEFRATTIIIKNNITVFSNTAIGSFKGNIYSMLNYLENVGLDLYLSKLYNLKNTIEYLINDNNLNNITVDFNKNDLFEDTLNKKLSFHVKIERITKVTPYFNKK